MRWLAMRPSDLKRTAGVWRLRVVRGSRQARLGRYVLALAYALALMLVSTATASASARWELYSRAAPTNLAPGSEGLLTVAAGNLGDQGLSGASQRVAITDVLPAGLQVSDPANVDPHPGRSQTTKEKEETWECSVTEEDRKVSCSTSLAVPPYERLEIDIPVSVQEPAGTVTSLPNEVGVQGGEETGGGTLSGATLSRPVRVSSEPVSFGVEEDGFSVRAENADGSPDTQAGSHPYQLSSTVYLNQTLEEVQLPGQPRKAVPAAPALSKTLDFDLPPGLLGNVTAAQQCTDADFSSLASTVGGVRNLCPPGSAIGVATVTILAPSPVGYKTLAVPVFNLVPAQGEPARFGFETEAVPVEIDASVRTDGDYGVRASVSNATAAAQVLGAQVILWGNPGEEVHDNSRGWACLRGGRQHLEGETCTPPEPRPTVPFLTLPSSCTGQLSSSMEGLAWTGDQTSASYLFQSQLGEPLASLQNCPQLPFEPSLEAQPEQEPGQPTTSASTPSGLDVKVRVDQQGTLTSGALGDSAVRSTSLVLPQGVLLNPGAANGLEACSEQQIGYQGGGGVDPLSPGAAEPLRFSPDRAECPQASKVGTVQIKTPLLGEELSGSVYLAAQEANPFGSLIALYIVAENEKLGLTVKLAGEGKLDQQTGQITTTFQNTPQVPFEELDVRLFGGPGGAVSTPAQCGTYTTNASFASWSGALREPAGEPPFAITSGPGGGPCLPSPEPFALSFQAGSASTQAGAFTQFQLGLTKPDGDQALSGLSLHLPAGVAAQLSSATPCPEPQAARNQCGPESLIGHSLASSGLGPDPISLPGSVYLTGPYEGAPFGLSVVTSAVAGPFDLGDVTVRSKIEVDPHTAQVTIQSDPFPTFVRGVPVQLKAINVSVDRPNFEYNPTSCAPMKIEGTLQGAEGQSQSVSSRFQVANCAALPFKPQVQAQTEGKTSKADGAGLSLKFASTRGQANVAKTVLTIPAILPARLSTIQKACLAKTFEANPASCPEGSDIGQAVVHTPVLKSPLTGPIYLVSHGNAAWPDAELVLQGEGITVILDGQTAIKKGITTSSFQAVPDAPFSSLEASLPEGPHSALTTNLPVKAKYSLCGQKLSIPMVLSGQNGALIEQQTKVSVQGCGAVKATKAKKLTRAQKLKKALGACRRRFKHSKARRQRCEAKARKAFGVKHGQKRGKTHSSARAH